LSPATDEAEALDSFFSSSSCSPESTKIRQ
jgi:hypothetical protein